MATAIVCPRPFARPRADQPAPWTEPLLHQAVETLYRHTVKHPSVDMVARCAVAEIVRLGLRPDLLAALRHRRDPEEAVRDLATRYAFGELMEKGRAFQELDALSQALVQRTLETIYRRAEQVERRTGTNPLEADSGKRPLLLTLSAEIARHTLRRPIGRHIQWKLNHPETAVSRAVRQIEHLVRHTAVREDFVAYVLAAAVPEGIVPVDRTGDEFKAGLLLLARGGGRSAVDYEATIRFFALPETVAFVRRFADRVQTARTLYTEESYQGVPWEGRRLPANCRQDYLGAALAEMERTRQRSLTPTAADAEDEDRLTARSTQVFGLDNEDVCDLIEADQPAHLREPFAAWLTRQALAHRPADPLWQAAALLYLHQLAPEEIAAQGLAASEAVTAAQDKVEALRADPEVWRIWLVVGQRTQQEQDAPR